MAATWDRQMRRWWWRLMEARAGPANALKHDCDQYLHLIELRADVIGFREVEVFCCPARVAYFRGYVQAPK